MVALVLAASLVVPAGSVVAQGGFSDIDEAGPHRAGVEELAERGVLEGTLCAPGEFCPGEPLQRWVMAVWLVRVLDGTDPVGSGTRFADVDPDEWWAPYVERLAVLGVTTGCAAGPARYCSHDSVTRGQMATFLTRAFDLGAASSFGFVDTEGNTHAASIDALAAAGVTAGCATSPARYCPADSVTRGQMATFLYRAEQVGAPDSGLCRPMGTGGTTAGFPLPDWAVPSTGTVRVAVLFVDFPDASADHSTQREAEPNLKQVGEYFEHASYGKAHFEFGVLHRWLRP